MSAGAAASRRLAAPLARRFGARRATSTPRTPAALRLRASPARGRLGRRRLLLAVGMLLGFDVRVRRARPRSARPSSPPRADPAPARRRRRHERRAAENRSHHGAPGLPRPPARLGRLHRRVRDVRLNAELRVEELLVLLRLALADARRSATIVEVDRRDDARHRADVREELGDLMVRPGDAELVAVGVVLIAVEHAVGLRRRRSRGRRGAPPSRPTRAAPALRSPSARAGAAPRARARTRRPPASSSPRCPWRLRPCAMLVERIERVEARLIAVSSSFFGDQTSCW